MRDWQVTCEQKKQNKSEQCWQTILGHALSCPNRAGKTSHQWLQYCPRKKNLDAYPA